MIAPDHIQYRTRIAALRKIMTLRRLDVFVTTFSPSLRYLCGYAGSNGLLAVTLDTTCFFTDFRYQEIIQTEVAADKKIIGQGSMVPLAAKQKNLNKKKRIAFEHDHVTVAESDVYQKFFGKKKLVPVSGIVELLRSVKDQSEIALLSRACAISDKVFNKILGIITPGISELEISAEISYWHKRFGAETDAFEVIAVSGERGSLPHGRASAKKIRSGEFVTLDFGCVVEGYHSDMTRTICVGRPTPEMKKVYQLVLDAQQKACDAVRVGMKARALDKIARSVISSKGYGAYFGHSLGHGVGLEIHELPRVALKSKETLTEGNVITIEPGIYMPKKFGVRIEDTVVVHTHGCDRLTHSPKTLTIV